MRFWIVAGGTGGHIYPALAVVQALQDIDPTVSLTWIGGWGGMEEELVARAGLSFLGIPAGGMHGVGPVRALRNAWRLLQGTAVAWRYLGDARPDGILTTGGYVSGPVAVAARLRKVPSLVFLPDIEPALSVKFAGKLAAKIAATVEDSRAFLPSHKVTITGYPLRREITRWDRASGRKALGLPLDVPIVLVFGGSRGARSINRAVVGQLADLLQVAHVVHISGTLDWEEVAAARAALPLELQERYRVISYLHEEMGAVLASADLAVSRAGASILGELPYFGLPAILVPYPYAWRYQKVNANWLAQRGAAVVVEDAELPERLAGLVRELLQDEPRRQAMVRASLALAQPEAAHQIAGLLLSLGQEGM